MDEQKQIVEMAKEIGAVKERIYRGVVCVGERRTTPRHSALIAKRLIKKGYCKQREGEWIDTGDEQLDNIYSGYKCSVCGFIICGHSGKYCADCGAKMKIQ